MRKLGLALLVAAAGISTIMTSLFGVSYWRELNSWLMIAVTLGVIGLVLLVPRGRGDLTATDADPLRR